MHHGQRPHRGAAAGRRRADRRVGTGAGTGYGDEHGARGSAVLRVGSGHPGGGQPPVGTEPGADPAGHLGGDLGVHGAHAFQQLPVHLEQVGLQRGGVSHHPAA